MFGKDPGMGMWRRELRDTKMSTVGTWVPFVGLPG